MKVSKWGNSLAIRIPADVAGTLDLKEGDDVDIRAAVGGRLIMSKRQSNDELWKRVEEIRKTSPLPAGYKFRRADAYED